MKKLLMTSAAAATIGIFMITGANAADLPAYVPPPPAPVWSWTGPYVGVTAGYGWGDSKFEDEFAVSNSFDIDGFIGGGTLGYNYQFGPNIVIGAETDFSYSDISGKFGPGNLGTPDGGNWGCGSGPCVTEVKWFGTVRGRVGYAIFNRLLVYGTGGLAYGKVKSDIEDSQNFHVKDTNLGWTAGGGIEYAFADHWSVKVEYLHVDLGWTQRSRRGVGFFRSHAEFDLVRGGVNWLF